MPFTTPAMAPSTIPQEQQQQVSRAWSWDVVCDKPASATSAFEAARNTCSISPQLAEVAACTSVTTSFTLLISYLTFFSAYPVHIVLACTP
jgi:hypothetical protein